MVEITGRRTGRSLRIPVCLHRVGDETLIFTERPWRHNLTGGAPVTVTHRGHIRHGRAVLVDAAPSKSAPRCARQWTTVPARSSSG